MDSENSLELESNEIIQKQLVDKTSSDTTSSSMDTIDKLTFELLVNKSHYKKYLSKSNPEKFREHSIFYEKIRKYRNRIVAVVSDLTTDPELQINNEMNDGFNEFMRTCIRFFEMKDLETDSENKYNPNSNPNFESEDFDDSENILFGNIANTNTDYSYSSRNLPNLELECSESESTTKTTGKSWWGGEQVKKSTKYMKYTDNFDMRMFSNT